MNSLCSFAYHLLSAYHLGAISAPHCHGATDVFWGINLVLDVESITGASTMGSWLCHRSDSTLAGGLHDY